MCYPLIPLGLPTLSWMPPGISRALPDPQAVWGAPRFEGGEAESHPPSSTGISGTFTAADPDIAGPAPASAADARCRAAQDLQNVAAQPFRVVLRHSTG